MASFTAYFDAGGAPNTKVLAVAGFVSDFRKWKLFEREWAGILAREGVSCFHMTDFVSSQGEFKGWKGQTDRRRIFITDLLMCAKRNVNKAFAAAVRMHGYRMVNLRYRLQEEAGFPYALCGHFCVQMVEKWRRKEKNRTVLYVFEDGDKHKGDLQRMCLTEGIEPEFAAKKLPPLQAADLLAWRTRNPLEEALKPTLTREKADGLLDTFSAAWKKFKHEAFYGDKEMLERFCVERGINPRR